MMIEIALSASIETFNDDKMRYQVDDQVLEEI